MRFRVHDRRHPDGSALLDVTLGACAADVTIAELLDTLEQRYPGRLIDQGRGRGFGGAVGGAVGGDDVIDLDGLPVPDDAPVADLPLRSGSVLNLRRRSQAGVSRTARVARPGRPMVDLTQIAGPDCGLTLRLGRGSFVAGRGGLGLGIGPIVRPTLRIAVDAAGGCEVAAADAQPVRLDGRTLAAGESMAVDGAGGPGRGAVVAVGNAVFRLAPAGDAATSAQPHSGAPAADPWVDGSGRVPLIRTPRVARPTPSAEVPVPQPPTAASQSPPMSWLLMLVPLPIGVVMALVFSPFFLIMAAMTPLMGLARWVEGRYRTRKEKARIAAESAAAATQFAEDLDAVRAAAAAAARHAHPDLGELWRRARTGRQLWQVRPGDADELRTCVGIGETPWRPELGRSGDALRAMPELVRVLGERDRLVDVPILVDLRRRAGLGLVGPARFTRRLAAAVVLDLVTRHGPADVGLVLLVEPRLLPDWEWVKWLPHLTGDDGTPRVATDAGAAVGLLSELAAVTPAGRGVPGGPVASGTAAGGGMPGVGGPLAAGAGASGGPGFTVVVVDGDELLTGRVAALLGRLSRGRSLVVTSRVQRLPSVCQSIVEVAADGTASVTDAMTGDRLVEVRATQAAAAVCDGTARALARWSDPEQATAAASLPDRARLVDLLAAAAATPEVLGRPVLALDAATIAGWWYRDEPGLNATLGVTEQGPLTVDLLSDGPHGLIVGTTGAGKSELLRSLVASLACRHSPDQLTFLLVDFKGGGAFDACAGLPHTAGLVTDLDEHLAARALQCLRAELRHRERRLRDAGVSDLRDYVAPSPPLPRLLIIIDEFATLAGELPGFLSALVDVAQRGRSLGIHLLLATQRPQGVVDGKIRANTNLRIALRVQDDADSRDVLGTRHAADIDRRRPGRGYVRLGAGEIVALQTALVSAPAATGGADRVEVDLFSLAPDPVADAGLAATTGSGAGPAATMGEAPADDAPTDLQALVAATVAAFEQAGYDAPRVPWPPPLPDVVDAWALADPPAPGEPADGAGPVAVPLGLVDLPDEQRSDQWWWRPEAGGTLVLGADSRATSAVLATACLALARCRHPDRQQIFILDGSGCGLDALAGLPQVAAVVGVAHGEQLSRTLDRLEAELAGRRSTGAPVTELLLVVAGWEAVVEGAERAGQAEVATRLERLLRDGGPLGIRVLLSAAHERGVPGRVMTQLATKLCLRLADPAGYTSLGLRAREVPELRGLRAIDLQTRRELVVARYGDGTPTSLADATARVAGRYPDVAPPPNIGVLPDTVPAAEVLGASAATGGTWRLGIGRYYRDLRVASLALAPGMHAVVAGPPGSGRTTALRVIAAAARASQPAAVVCVVAADPAAWDPAEVSELVSSFDELRRWPGEGRGLLLVDGVEAMGPAAASILDRLVPALPPVAHVVVAGRPDALRGLQPWQRAVTMSRTGLLLQPTTDDGEILRTRLPREAPPRPIPGRGYLVDAGGAAQIQAAFLPTIGDTPANDGHRASAALQAARSLPPALFGGAR